MVAYGIDSLREARLLGDLLRKFFLILGNYPPYSFVRTTMILKGGEENGTRKHSRLIPRQNLILYSDLSN